MTAPDPTRGSIRPADDAPEAPANELARLCREWHERDENDITKEEAWNLIADWAVENEKLIVSALRRVEAPMLSRSRTAESHLAAGKVSLDAANHTPGPWRYEAQPYWTGDQNSFVMWGGDYYICRVSDASESPENEANARLIAAAPDMLAALRQAQLEMSFAPLSMSAEYVAALRAVASAIAKAEGRGELSAADIEREAAGRCLSEDRLGKLLYEALEHLDPGPEPKFVEWSNLGSHERDLYRHAIMRVIAFGRDDIRAAIAKAEGRGE